MKTLLLFFLGLSCSLFPETVDFISCYDMSLFCPLQKMAKRTGFKIHYLQWNSHLYFGTYFPKHHNNIDKVVVFANDGPSLEERALIPKNKIIQFVWEPPRPGVCKNPSPYASRVYTFDDEHVDNVLYFKYYYPALLPMVSHVPSFKEKKLCVMVSRAATKERKKIIQFFETKPDSDFDLFGYQPVVPSSRYRGPVPGHEFDMQKSELMKNYRFAICFENSSIPGYISEKIFACLAGGCVPVYWGAPNVEKYIPKGCFIDYRAFQTDEELYQFLKNMSKETYQKYIDNIRSFLVSPQAKLFSAEHFSDILKEAVKATTLENNH